MNRTSGQREIEATCSKLHFHLLLCLFLGLKNTSCISASSNSKPSPGRVNSEGSFPRPLAELALASVATWKGIYSGTSKWRLEETAELDSEIDSIFISFIASVINVKPNNLAKRMCVYVCACAHSECCFHKFLEIFWHFHIQARFSVMTWVTHLYKQLFVFSC